MDQAERGQQTDPRMRPQQSDASVVQALLLEPQRGLDDALVEHQQQLQPLLLLLFHYRRHRRGAQLLLADFGEQLGAPRQTRLQRQRLQTVLDDGTHLDQFVAVTQHAQNLAALERRSVQPRKLIMDQQIQNQFRVASIVLLSPTRAAPNLGRVAQPDFVAKFFEQLFEPGAVTTGLQPDDDAPHELRVEGAYFVLVLMFEFVRDELTTFSCQITDRLLSCMKVNADIYCFHSASFQSHVQSTGREFTTRGRRRLLHNIKLQLASIANASRTYFATPPKASLIILRKPSGFPVSSLA